ncbi:MAG: hypothetical protein H7X79_00855 [Sporomusaceae bacterium]|nr:hypothetical protein [Sporomusaceae bacterium]
MVAAATLLSTAVLPGLPAAVAHASPSTSAAGNSATTLQQVAKASQPAVQINFTESVLPTNELIKQVQEAKQENKTPEPSPTTNKAPDTAAKPAAVPQANPNAQPDPNTKAPDTAAKPAAVPQANPNAQPDPNTKAPDTAAKPAAVPQANPNVQPDPNINKESPGNPPANYKEVLNIKATAYAPGPHDNGKWGNLTHIGTQVRPGIIAVDPNVIPLGSRVYIEYPDGHGEYAIAEDTGGAIKGNRVDIAKWSVNEAYDFGIQNVKVYVVDSPSKI